MLPFVGPKLRDDLPRYPHLLQLLRVTATKISGPAIAGSSALGAMLYLSFTEQLADSLVPRDREPCLADDVRGLGVSPGYHLGRLAGSYSGLPVYEVVDEDDSGDGTITIIIIDTDPIPIILTIPGTPGLTVCILTLGSGLVHCYKWLCFGDVCGWYDLCACTWYPTRWYCTPRGCIAAIQAEVPPVGTLSVGSGGTGTTSLTAHGVLLGQGTSSITSLAISTAGRMLLDQGASADPAWKALSGDGTLAGTGALTLSSTAVTPGSYGDSTHVATFTVDAKGRLTAAGSAAISGGGSPGGSNTYVQFNDSSAFGGDAGFYFNKATGQIGMAHGAGATARTATFVAGSVAAQFGDGTGVVSILDGTQVGRFYDGSLTVTILNGTYAISTDGLISVLGGTGATYRWASGTSAPSTQTLLSLPLNVYGAGTITDLLGDPDAWVLVNINGTDYKIPAYL